MLWLCPRSRTRQCAGKAEFVNRHRSKRSCSEVMMKSFIAPYNTCMLLQISKEIIIKIPQNT